MGEIWVTENQNYNFAGKKEECNTWHLRMFLRCIKVPLDPLKCQVLHPFFFPAKLYFFKMSQIINEENKGKWLGKDK